MANKYVVIGNPIAQSKGPLVYGMFAKETGKEINYTKLEGELGKFAQTIDAFRANGGSGLNITAPFKLDAFAYATDISDRARLAGAVNAIKFVGDKIYAENFDGVGLVRDITHNLGFPIKGKRVLILGAGGAARGATHPFLAQKPTGLVIADVNFDVADKLAKEMCKYGPVTATTYGELIDQKFDMVVNATSASLRGELPPVPATVFDVGCLAYELVYGKGLTPFLHLAKNTGVRHLHDGVGMMVEQAAEAFLWWRGVRPDTKSVIEHFTVPLV